MKKLLPYFAILVNLNFAFSQKGLNILSNDKVGLVENEAYIKVNYQQPIFNQGIEYNITYLGAGNWLGGLKSDDISAPRELEFWGHGYNTLSIFGTSVINLRQEEVNRIVNAMMTHYKFFNKNIRLKGKIYQHYDLKLFENHNLVFSCYLNRLKAEYAFWMDNHKYQIDEKDFLVLMGLIKTYFNLELNLDD
jgi:hypothetical protein